MKLIIHSIFVLLVFQQVTLSQPNCQSILTGAARTDQYIGLLKNKRVGVFANQTSIVNGEHLVDLLLQKKVLIKKIFSPEHGFRGTADAGEKITNEKDAKTGLPILSLYGKKTIPSAEDLKDVDVLVFDIQDIGARFFTYISSLEDFMEGAIENNKPLIILDRPNPNGFYVDGPVLDKKFKSFVGRQPVPVVHGMTIGEYAKMLVGEKWLNPALQSKITKASVTVIPCMYYTHKSTYTLPVKPSPNLPDMSAIYLYPSTCFFEGTVLSEGRGTDKPFQLFGHPSLPKNLVSFTPHSKEGAKDPKLKDQLCYGWDLSGTPAEALKKINGQLQLKWLLEAYRLFPDKKDFFRADGFFDKLAGNDLLVKQIKEGKTETAIRESWQPALKQFKKIRKKYLLYEDFE